MYDVTEGNTCNSCEKSKIKMDLKKLEDKNTVYIRLNF